MSTGRPAGGYKTKDGKRVPGVTTITGRWKESGGLIMWAWKMGSQGIDLNAARDTAADAGTACHDMIDCHLHGRKFDPGMTPKPIIERAEHAFLGFLEWQQNQKLKLIASEVSLVSERHSFGGTFDAGMTGENGGGVIILDYKTSNGIYGEMLVQVAGGYTLLWQEHYPDKPIGGIDILRVSKPEADDDPVSFHHHHWSAEVVPLAQKQFLLFREAYDLDKRLAKMV